MPAQAALGRHLSPRALLPFGRRAGATQAGLQREVEHWQRELQAEQVLPRLLARVSVKVSSQLCSGMRARTAPM